MSLAALSDVEDAIEATKRLLTPFDRVRWFRLAVVMFFVGGAGFPFPSLPTGGSDFGGGPEPGEPAPGGPPPEITPQITSELIALAVGVLLVGVALFLLYSVLAATMEFVFVGSLRDEEVRIRRNVKRHWRKGLRLFGFRFGVWLLTVGVSGLGLLGVGTAMSGWPPTPWSDGAILAVALLAIPLFVLVALVVGTFLGFTTMFVVPVMLREERGVIGGWRRFWPTLQRGWKEFLAYLVVSFLLSIAVGIAVSFLTVLLAVAIAVPFLIVGVPLGLVLGLSDAGGLVIVVLVFAYALLVFIGALLVQVPFQTFLRYYALLVLGDVNDDFDLVPDARAAVRTDGGGDEGGTSTEATPGDGGPGEGPGGVRSGSTDRSADSVDDEWNVDRSDDR